MSPRASCNFLNAVLCFCGDCITVLPISTEAALSQRQGAAGVCSSTLKKLRGFTCLLEPSIDRTYSETEQGTHEGSGGKVSEQKTQVLRLPNVSHQPVYKSGRHQPEQENEDEEEEQQEEASSRLTSLKKVPVPEFISCL